MKIALCFIISYDHSLNKEQLWKDWIESNKDIINIYVHYKNPNSFKTHWLKSYSIPPNLISKTSYYHVVPAYISILSYAVNHDLNNRWFCMLTESCVPIISPDNFRKLFYRYHDKSILKCQQAYWNIELHKRANLRYLKKEYHLANDPWFILSKMHVHMTIRFMLEKHDIYKKVCSGGLANESIFAIILQTYKQIDTENHVNSVSTIVDWSRMSNPTSPHLFKLGNQDDISIINNLLKENKYACFLRKVEKTFPDEILKNFIYKSNYDHEYPNIGYNFLYFRDKYKKIFIITGLIIFVLYYFM